MKKIILFGSAKDGALRRLLWQNLSKEYRLVLCAADRLRERGQGEEVLLFESQQMQTLEGDRAVLVFKNSADAGLIGRVDAGLVAIIHSENTSAAEQAAALGLAAVTCGMSRKDTITFSSLSEQSGVVSLLRAVTALDGEIYEPFEIPVRWTGRIGEYNLLCYVMLLIMLSYRFDAAGLFVEAEA